MNHEKEKNLQRIIKDMGELIVAYSGGADSTFLLRIAKDVLSGRVMAVTARSPIHPARERNKARRFAQELGVKHIVIGSDELNIPGFVENSPERCYHCKKNLWTKLKAVARRERMSWIADGTNLDDAEDFRPGMRAAEEFGIRSPLLEAEFTKKDVRKLSLKMGLPDGPPSTCLGTRFPYGNPITREKLESVEKAEDFLADLGVRQVRVRHHDEVARIEVGKDEIALLASPELRTQILEKLKHLGYRYVTIDLEGYRTGSMNEVL